jgi:NADPH:quinone reductase-like Zn-dependent oxidoreductase
MKAAICTKYGQPEVLQIQELPVPQIGKNEILVRVEATSVTSSDCYVRAFSVPLLLKPLMGMVVGFSKPRMKVLGMVYSGTIVGKDKNVEYFSIGDKVYGFDRFNFSAYAEYKIVKGNGVFGISPKNLNFVESAAIPYGATLAFYYLKKANITTRKHVLVIGASGAVGSSAVQLANYYKSEVVGICSSANSMMVQDLGAKRTIDYKADSYLCMEDRFDLVFNCVPAAGRKKDENKKKYEHLLSKEGIYIDVSKGTPVLNVVDLQKITELVEMNALKPVIDRIYNLEEIADAHRYVESWHKKGSVIVKIGKT